MHNDTPRTATAGLRRSSLLAEVIPLLVATVCASACVDAGGEVAEGELQDAAVVPETRAAALAADWISVPAVSDPSLTNLTIPADAPTRGMWSPSVTWPLNAIHAIVLSDGRLLTFGTPFNNPAAQDGRYYDVWNPAFGFTPGAHLGSVTPDPVNSFCGTSAWLGDGRLLVSGGNGNGGKSSGFFSTTTTSAVADGASLTAERWYATMLNLADGRTLILGGTVPYQSPITSQTPEIYANGQWSSLFGASSKAIFGVRQLGSQPEANPWYYPRAWVAGDGSVFGVTSNIMFQLRPDDAGGSGSIVQVGTFKTPQDGSGASTPNVGFTSTAVMFEPGRILQVGGNGTTDNNGLTASLQASVFDIRGASPVYSDTAPMAYRRHWANATVLPTGRVVVTGGTTVGWEPANAVRPAEIWDPSTGTWTVGASNVETRTYHSSALLLPNGTVFTGGGGAPGAVNNLNAELYYPPQLFTTVNGVAQLAKRPVITALSTLKGSYGGSLGIELSDATQLGQVSLLALGSVTHSFNNTQRRIPLAFTQSGSTVTAALPAGGNLAPPGYYMVFAVDAAGVYSRGAIVALGNVPAPPLPSGAAGGVPAGAVGCAGENGTCTIPAGQTASVYYGAGGAYVVRAGLTGAVQCSNAAFGDPIPGTVKACSYVLERGPKTIDAFAAPILALGATASYAPAPTAGATYTWSFGDGSATTPASASPAVSHVFAAPGVYTVTLNVTWSDRSTSSRTFQQAVYAPVAAGKPSASSAEALELRANGASRLWVANPDADTVTVLDAASYAKLAEIAVGSAPRSVAVAPDGRVWVVNKGSSTLSIIDPGTLSVVASVTLARAAQPHGLVFAGGSAYVVLEATGQLLRLDAVSGALLGASPVGPNPRHVAVSADEKTLLVSRFITRPLPGEGTATVDTSSAGGEVLVFDRAALTLLRTVVLRHSDKVDGEAQGSGIPNYLGAPVISPDGKSAWVPSKQDNVKRGVLRSGLGLNFVNTVRAISSRIDLTTFSEDTPRRVDHDNASLGSAAAFHPSGAYLFVALETSRQVAVVDPVNGRELTKLDVGRAPQAMAVSADGSKLFVQNFMDRTVSVLDLTGLVTRGELGVPVVATLRTAANEALTSQVLRGKQLFYDARDPRLARDSYMSCASCHNDAGHDGRTWDFTGFGEGLRNTPPLVGRGGMAQGFAHWSGNFDEVQDFEGQIRSFAGGTGLMTDAQFGSGTRSTPLGDKKAGVSADLDALAAYLGSLTRFEQSPYRNGDGSLTAAAAAGKVVFASAGCASCHGGAGFTASSDGTGLRNVGTLAASSGQRLGAALTGLDIPTLRDAWNTAPYLHDGSAATLAEAIQAHSGNTAAGTDLANLSAYVQQIGRDEPGVLTSAGTGTGLSASYFANNTLTAPATLVRSEVPWFDWGTGAAAASLPADNFSVRWSGQVEALEAGTYQFRTNSDDGVRVWINGALVIDNWTAHAPLLDTSAGIYLAAGQRVSIVVEYNEYGGGAVLQLSWLRPGGAWAAVPAAQLYAPTLTSTGTGLSASYFANNTLTAPAALVRTEAPWFDWGTAAAAASLPADNFSVRWSGQVEAIEAGTYQFRTHSDDGVRVWINGVQVINNWTAHAPVLDTTVGITLAAGQRASIVIEYNEYGGGAVLQLSWLRPGGAWAAVPAAQLYATAAVSNGTGLSASYFANNTLTAPAALVRTEAPWFDWGTAAAAASLPADNFSVRWSGQVEALEAGTYQFRTQSDDGVRVWINGVQLINNWTAHAPVLDTTVGITLAAGQRASIVVEYNEYGGGAVLQLSWLRPGGAWAAVPAAQLYAP